MPSTIPWRASRGNSLCGHDSAAEDAASRTWHFRVRAAQAAGGSALKVQAVRIYPPLLPKASMCAAACDCVPPHGQLHNHVSQARLPSHASSTHGLTYTINSFFFEPVSPCQVNPGAPCAQHARCVARSARFVHGFVTYDSAVCSPVPRHVPRNGKSGDGSSVLMQK